MKQKKMKHKKKRRAVDRNFTSVSFCHSEKVMNLIRGPVWFQEYFTSLKLDVWNILEKELEILEWFIILF